MFLPLHDDNPMRHLPRPYANYTLIAFTILCFFMTGGLDPYAVEGAAYGLGYIPAVVHGPEVLAPGETIVPQTATYITYAFLHANWLHLLGNMAFLWVFGDNIEDALGHFRYIAFYLACAVAAAFVHGFADPRSIVPLIGASGAVAGVVGAYLVLHPRVKLWILLLGRVPIRLRAMWVLGFWALFQFFNILVAPEDDMTAWWAHIGGMAAGALLVIVLRRRGVQLFDAGTPVAD